jgi:hypothetical protein
MMQAINAANPVEPVHQPESVERLVSPHFRLLASLYRTKVKIWSKGGQNRKRQFHFSLWKDRLWGLSRAERSAIPSAYVVGTLN